MPKNPKDPHWPSVTQQLLLRAALLSGDSAKNAWSGWKNVVDLQDLDGISQNLLPLLYRNAQRNKFIDPFLSNLRANYLKVWSKNSFLLNRAGKVIAHLGKSDIQVMLLKGGALILQYYRDFGVRPMWDVDIVVHVGAALRTIRVLQNQGFSPTSKLPYDYGPEFLVLRHGQNLVDPEGYELDLHWHVIHLCTRPDDDDEFWEGSNKLEFQNLPLRALNPADQLLHICVHGLLQINSSFRWIADAMAVLNAPSVQINWERLLRLAHDRRLALPVSDALVYLHQQMDAPVPDEVLEEFARIKLAPGELREYRVLSSKPVLLGRWLRLLANFRRIAPLEYKSFTWRRFRLFMRYLQYVWEVDKIWQVPFVFVFKGIRRTGKTITAD